MKELPTLNINALPLPRVVIDQFCSSLQQILAGRTMSKEQVMKDGYYQLMQCCFGGKDISFTDICIDLRRLIRQCEEAGRS